MKLRDNNETHAVWTTERPDGKFETSVFFILDNKEINTWDDVFSSVTNYQFLAINNHRNACMAFDVKQGD